MSEFVSELASKTFDLRNLPARCAGGLAVDSCVYTKEMIDEAAGFSPDKVLIRGSEDTWEHRNLLYPPKVRIEKGQPEVNKPCGECGQLCIVRFEMIGAKIKPNSKVELEYRQTDDESSKPKGSSAFLIRSAMLDPNE